MGINVELDIKLFCWKCGNEIHSVSTNPKGEKGAGNLWIESCKTCHPFIPPKSEENIESVDNVQQLKADIASILNDMDVYLCCDNYKELFTNAIKSIRQRISR